MELWHTQGNTLVVGRKKTEQGWGRGGQRIFRGFWERLGDRVV
jgi:hypothetical protein